MASNNEASRPYLCWFQRQAQRTNYRYRSILRPTRCAIMDCARRTLARWSLSASDPTKILRSWRTDPKSAWRYPELEYANAGSSYPAIVLDCDNPAALKRGLGDLPDPNWVVWRAADDHAHVSRTLARPVHRHSAARVGPLRFYANILDLYTATVGADASDAGTLAWTTR